MTSEPKRSRSNLPSPIFALVIGINTYGHEDYPDLQCAAADADETAKFLVETLGTPPENVVNLRNRHATRDAIISEFRALEKNERIKIDDAAIVIYYSGHGATGPIPDNWERWEASSTQIEMICPSDIGLVAADGQVIVGIPDRTISVMLDDLSKAKGDNITFICDCCHSAGLNRGLKARPSQVGDRVMRWIPNPPIIPGNCDNEILNRGTRGAGIARGFAGQNRGSHVLLAACGRGELAWEHPATGRGFFTTNLLKLLRDLNLEMLTYSSLMHKIEKVPDILYDGVMYTQTPHCEGLHVNRRLFNSKAIGAARYLIPGQKEGAKIHLLSGDAQGVNLHSKFAIYASDIESDTNPQLGILVVTDVDSLDSQLGFVPGAETWEVPVLFYAKQIEYGKERIYRIYRADAGLLDSVLVPQTLAKLGLVAVDSKDKADLAILVEDGEFVFDMMNSLITPHIGSRLPHRLPIHKDYYVLNILVHAANFNYQLRRTGDDLADDVVVEFHELSTDWDETFECTRTPMGPDIFEMDNVRVVVDPDAYYGMRIQNNGDTPLYPYVFYFDPFEFSILAWFLGPSATDMERVDAPLLEQSQLTLGYGDGGVEPWGFSLRDGEDVDVGFFKVFLTTSPADFASITQESPFDDNVSRIRGLRPSRLSAPPKMWGSKTIKVLQTST